MRDISFFRKDIDKFISKTKTIEKGSWVRISLKKKHLPTGASAGATNVLFKTSAITSLILSENMLEFMLDSLSLSIKYQKGEEKQLEKDYKIALKAISKI